MNDRLKLTTGGGGVLAVFGLPFLAAGLFVILAPTLGFEVHNESGGQASPVVRWVLGGIFSSLGGTLVFGRAGIVIDRSRDQFTRWWGLLFPMIKRTQTLSEFELVGLYREVRTSSNSNGGRSSYTVFPVRLRAKAGDDVDLTEPRVRQQARAIAERVAKFLDMGIADATGERERVRAAGTLDDSLREQLRDDLPPTPQQPPLGEAQYHTEGRTAIVELPAPGFIRSGGLGSLFGLLAVPMFAAFFFVGGFTEDPIGRGLSLAFGGFVLLFTLVPLVFVLRNATTVERLQITPDSVDLERRGPLRLGSLRQSVPMDELEEVELQSPARGRSVFGVRTRVVLQTDDVRVLVGGGLDEEAQRWLRELIRYVAAHQKAPEPARV